MRSEPSPKSEIALVTGCTSGIGLYLAREFAAHGHDLVLVAPVERELEEVRSGLCDEFGIKAEIIACNLELEDSPAEIFDHLQSRDIEITILVNNAGHGFRGKFWENPIALDESVVRLNVLAPLRLTKLFLPPMLARGAGKILNTASIAGFEPGPLLAVYHASKAFLLSWSEALSVELEATGVRVTTLCPGPTDTDFFPKAGMVGVSAFQQAKVMAPQDVAKAGFEALMKGDHLIVPGISNKMLVMGRRFLTEEAQAKLNEKFYQEVPADERERQRGDIEAEAHAQS